MSSPTKAIVLIACKPNLTPGSEQDDRRWVDGDLSRCARSLPAMESEAKDPKIYHSTSRQKARKAYLAIAKQKCPTAKVRRKGIKQQLQYLRRNLKHIEGLLEHGPQGQPIPLPRWLLYCYWVIQHLYAQQWDMYLNRNYSPLSA